MCIVRADWWGRTLALALGAWVFCKPWAHGRESSGICCERMTLWRCLALFGWRVASDRPLLAKGLCGVDCWFMVKFVSGGNHSTVNDMSQEAF